MSVNFGQLAITDIAKYGSMHENYDAETGKALAPTAAQSEGGVFTGFVGWNLLIQNMLMGTAEGNYLLLKINDK